MVSTQEQETLQLRALKLQTPIKGKFGLSTLTLRDAPSLPPAHPPCSVIARKTHRPQLLPSAFLISPPNRPAEK